MAKLYLDPSTNWARFTGEPEELDAIEYTLNERAAQLFLERTNDCYCSLSLSYVMHKDNRALTLLAGIVPLLDGSLQASVAALPKRKLWQPEDYRLERLREWGWRDYQIEAIKAAATAPLSRSILSLCTGAGKTRVAWGLAYVLLEDSATSMPWRYVVYGKSLVEQAREAFAELDKLHGSKLTLSVHSWEDLPFSGPGVIVDECHQVSARNRSLRFIEGHWPYKVGLSGTPLDRADSKNLLTIGLLGPVVYKVELSQLQGEGHLSDGVVKICVVE